MRYLCSLLPLLFVCLMANAQVKPTAPAIPAGRVAAANAMLDASGLESQTGGIYANIVSALSVNIPPEKKDKFRTVMLSFLSKYMSYTSLKDDFAKVYAEEFTEEELKDITKFYLTPAGKKMNSKLALLQQKGMAIAQQKLQDHSAELQQEMQKELGN